MLGMVVDKAERPLLSLRLYLQDRRDAPYRLKERNEQCSYHRFVCCKAVLPETQGLREHSLQKTHRETLTSNSVPSECELWGVLGSC